MNPKMILFDYGGTLIQDPIYKMTEGNSAIFPYITENPHNVTKEQFSDFVKQLFDEIFALYDEIQDDFRVTFHGFKKDVFADEYTEDD